MDINKEQKEKYNNIIEELRQKYDYKWQEIFIDLINEYDTYIWNILTNILDNKENNFCMLNIPYHITLEQYYENIYKKSNEGDFNNGEN